MAGFAGDYCTVLRGGINLGVRQLTFYQNRGGLEGPVYLSRILVCKLSQDGELVIKDVV